MIDNKQCATEQHSKTYLSRLMMLYEYNYLLLERWAKVTAYDGYIQNNQNYILRVRTQHQTRYTLYLDLHYSFYHQLRERNVPISYFKVCLYLDSKQAELIIGQDLLKGVEYRRRLTLLPRYRWCYNSCLAAVLRSF